MSSSAAGKFQDHYIVLGIETNADSETIQAAYSKLAQKYHPGNAETGNKEKFDQLNQAYEVLSDAGLRLAFDQVKGVDRDSGSPKFSGRDFFRALEMGAGLRSAVLCVLYDRRRVKSFKPSLSLRQLEGMLIATPEELNFAIWYLKKRGLVANDDKSNMEISVEGMDFLEQSRPSADVMMAFMKEDALAEGAEPLRSLAKVVERDGAASLREAMRRK
jgi:curved DNA-binding protein CbpA